jgi:hypothetical protein
LHIAGAPFEIERVRLTGQDVAIEGRFELPPLAQLAAEDQIFVAAFVRCHGSIKQMEQFFGVSYPTIKNRLNRIGAQLPFAEIDPEPDPERPLDGARGRPPVTATGDLLSQLENIRVPNAVVKGGMRLGAIIATFAGEKAAQRMKARGLDLDLSTINGDLSRMNGAEFDTFMKSLDEMNIEIDDGKSQVRITAE